MLRPGRTANVQVSHLIMVVGRTRAQHAAPLQIITRLTLNLHKMPPTSALNTPLDPPPTNP